MSLALTHFAVGAALTTLLLTILPMARYPRTAVLAGGAWAMLPDLHWVSPVGREALHAFHGSLLADAFWFHRTLDGLDPTDSPTVAAAALGLFLVATAVAERRDYRTPRVVETAYERYLDSESE